MKNYIHFEDLGRIRYEQAWNYQEEQHADVLSWKKQNINESCMGKLLICEHEHVYTLGKSGQKENLLVGNQLLKEKGIEFFQTNRGGDITYHGPGQIVMYPILDLEKMKLSVRDYVSKMEEFVIDTLNEYGIKAGRLDGATGVWLQNSKRDEKICAIGIRVSRAISMHGLAFNVNTDLNYFQYINPCGFMEKGVTSLAKIKGEKILLEDIKKKLIKNFLQTYDLKIE